MSQLKFSLKIWNIILIGGSEPPGYALAQDLKNVPWQKKIRPVTPVLPSHAGIMPVTEKKPD